MVEDDIRLALSGPSKADRLSALNKLENVIPSEIQKVLVDIEEVQLTLADYRNKERFLQDISRLSQTQSEETQSVVVHHLLGTLYINFEKFWGPTLRVIIELLSVSKHQNRLLHQLLHQLKRSNDFIYGKIEQDLPQDRPDHVLHRNFILQILAKFASFVAANSVLFMDEMLLFINQELMVSPFIERLARQNLKEKSEAKKRKTRPSSGTSATKSKETFITMTRIVQTFRNMSYVHRQAELKEFVLDLLSCRDASMQKAAFNCLTAYDNQYVNLYAEKILKLLDDKKIRSELSAFSIDSEAGQINNDHRDEIIPIIHRVLFGRMIGKVGRKTAGRDNADKRKSTVMRYVTGCTTEEVIGFFGILFDPLFKFVDVPYECLETAIDQTLSIENYVPLNKLQAMVITLESYLETVANLKPETLSYLFKMINIIAYCVVVPLEDKNLLDQIDYHSVKTLKILRRECLEITTEYFSSFAFYRFSQVEMDFIFKTLVWPSSKGFVDRNHATVTPMLKLINALTQNQVYHKLMVKRNKSNKEEYLLRHLMGLYADHKIERPVSKYVAQMLFNLLQLKTDDDADDETLLMDVDGPEPELLLLDDKDSLIDPHNASLYSLSGNENLGFQMIMLYLPVIFDRLKQNCERCLEKKDKNYRLESNELHILSALSVYLKDSSHCSLATELLLSTLEHQKSGDLIISTLKTTQALMKQVDKLKDLKIVEYIANTLSFQRNIEQRKELCRLVETLARIDTNLEQASRAITLMNSTNEDLIDQPDLAAWNEGFSIAFKYIDDLGGDAMNCPQTIEGSMIMLLHQTGYIINTVDRYEFSVRENCSIFYEKLAAKINLIETERNSKLVKKLVGEIILEKFVKKGLRETNDSIKHTYLGIVRILALGCHEKNTTLSEFHMFCNTNLDLDFWHNIRDIKLHNRSKALARLVADEKLVQVSPRTLASYFMPIASGFLFNKNYKSMASLTENSITMIGIICRHLGWPTYESTLNYYLDLLMKANTTYQRTNIKVITEILKNFNFSLETCEEAMQYEEENERLAVRMKRRCGQAVQQEKLDAGPKPKRLPPSTARMIYFSVTKRIISKLNSCLHEMARVDFEYDKHMSDYMPEKEDIKRIPMAFAIVQLLSLLPGKYVLLRDQLPALFLKLTTFLKSKNEDTRKAARATLLRIMAFLGPAYLTDMLRVLRQNLDKGFYVHVLNYTVHSVLSKLSLQHGDLDSSAHDLMNLCKEEIFGKAAEDKEVAKVLAKTPEAKKTKSYDTLLILAQYITAEKLELLINPIKQLLKTANEPKVVNKLAVCLQRIFTGLAQNEQFPLDELLSFVQSSIEDSIPNLRVRQKVDQAEEPENQPAALREDRYLIGKDKTKNRLKSKINEKGNLHMVVENSLRLLLLMFEKNKAAIKRSEGLQLKLDGLIALLTTCLKSSSPRCVMRSLKCLHFIAQTKIDLPSFRTTCNSIVKKIFILLSLYNGVGMVQGDNYEMIAMCFKTLTLLLLTCEHVELNGKQVRALMSYIEQDIHDASRQATAFRALSSLLRKRCDSPELGDIMAKVADLLVTSSDESVRLLSTKIWQTYLLEYQLDANALQTHLTKFLRQIDYEFIDGRRSVLRMLRVIVEKFPERILRNYMELFFHLLAQRVVNDDSKEIREVVGRLIALLMQRLPDMQTFVLNKFVFPWASGNNPEIKMLGVKLISIFTESNATMFMDNQQDLVRALAIVSEVLEPPKGAKASKLVNGKAKKRNESHDEDDHEAASDVEMDENTSPSGADKTQSAAEAVSRRANVQDKLVYHSLRLFKRLLAKGLISCTETRHIGQLKVIWASIATSKLTHWYEPVVLTSCELYMTFITKTTLGASLQVREPKLDNYLDWNATRIVRVLCDKFLELLDRFDSTTKVYPYIMQSLILLGQMVANSPATLEFEQKYCDSFDNGDVLAHMISLEDLPSDGFAKDHLPYQITEARKRCDLMWLSIKCVMQARKEAALFRMSQSHRRDLVLRWSAALAQELGASRIAPYVVLHLMVPVRELTDKAKNKQQLATGGGTGDDSMGASLVPMAQDLMKFVKSLVGVEQFNQIYSKVQLHYTRKRVERKAAIAQAKVINPARASKRKVAENKKKQVNKRRRIIAARK